MGVVDHVDHVRVDPEPLRQPLDPGPDLRALGRVPGRRPILARTPHGRPPAVVVPGLVLAVLLDAVMDAADVVVRNAFVRKNELFYLYPAR